MNYLDNDFVEDIVKRVFGWLDFHNGKNNVDKEKQLGLFAVVSTWMPHCRNTGIYENDIAQYHTHSEIILLFPGFNWTKETLRKRTVEYLKELQLKHKEDSLNEDFDD